MFDGGEQMHGPDLMRLSCTKVWIVAGGGRISRIWVVRQLSVVFSRCTVTDALRDVQVVAAQQGVTINTNEVEEAFGGQLDHLLDRFG